MRQKKYFFVFCVIFLTFLGAVGVEAWRAYSDVQRDRDATQGTGDLPADMPVSAESPSHHRTSRR